MNPFRFPFAGLMIITLLSWVSTFAESVVVDDFNDNAIGPEWQVEGATFTLSVENEALKVNYNRTASSWEWDQFHYIFSNQPGLMQYQLIVKIKSTVATELAVKPSYTDGSSDWITQNIPVSPDYQEFTFAITSASQKVLETIYFYFDAGTTTPKNGEIFIDQIVLETTSTALLSLAIENAGTFINSAEAGTAEGQFSQASINAFSNAKTEAQQVLNNLQSTQNEIDAALLALNDANNIIEASRIRSPKLTNLALACTIASFETQNVYYNLRQIAKYNTLFGMQDATGYGVGWSGNNFRSDVEDVCGALPAVCSWSIKDVAKGTGFDDLRERILYIYNKGGINTLEWHMDNPYGGDFYWENNPYPDSNVVRSILPGGVNHLNYKNQLNNIALFLRNLKGNRGESVPVIFRPWHEHNGDWFWWGNAHCSIDEYKSLWAFTVEYLVNDRKVNNLLFAYSPDRFYTKANYLQKYPGDNYIDIFGHDNYGDVSSASGIPSLITHLRHLVEMAEERNKIPALTETGLEGITNSSWFTQFMLIPIESDPVAKRIAYQAVWRNASTSHHYAPYPGHPVVPDFMEFYNDPFTTFLNDLPDVYHNALTITSPLIIQKFDLNQLRWINIFPNPAQKQLNIRNSGPNGRFEIVNMQGKRIETGDLLSGSDSQYDVRSYAAGLYLLKTTFSDGSGSQLKFLIQH